jgi:2-dehydro-3-deoxyphosphooctonate aldolase (KDO 8-P synthase)
MRDKLVIISGPCVIEDYETCAQVAEVLANLQAQNGNKLHCVFKSSFDKANRTSIASYRGLGIEVGMDMLEAIKSVYHLPITTDFHTSDQVLHHGARVDVIQIPALLSRQTDLIASAAMVGSIVNVKKGQFMKPADAMGIHEKAKAARPDCELWITERGTSFGYGRLVVDFTGFDIMRPYADRLIMDCTHSNNGKRSDTATLAKCAIAAGADGLFIETHPNPDQAKCDGPNSLDLRELGPLVGDIIALTQGC